MNVQTEIFENLIQFPTKTFEGMPDTLELPDAK